MSKSFNYLPDFILEGAIMYTDKGLYIAKAFDRELYILPKMANRHGLIAGATGTGKTVSLKVLAESFSDMGVPVIMADVKGDLAGMVRAGGDNASIGERVSEFGLLEKGFTYKAFPTCFWDLFAKKGLPLRTTISEFGPLLLAKLLDLNQVQSDILNIVFKIADDEGLLLIDIKDLKAMLNYVSENSAQYKAEYGNISSQSVAAIMRAVVALSDRGAEQFFGEPALNIRDWMRTTLDSRAYINIIDASSLIQDTLAYSTFMLWMLSELFETMQEVGDLEKPKMVFFFDEAHLLFKNTPKAMMQKIEQVMKLIRSKGIGIYFISQSPGDIPGEILAQLGNKIQHALRAYTAAEQKAVKAAVQSYRVNPNLDTQKAITELGIGEALVSFIQEDGSPDMVERAYILPPQSYLGAIGEEERRSVIVGSDLYHKYIEIEDRDSAYEFLSRVNEVRENEKLSDKESKERAKEEEKDKKRMARNIKSVGNTAVGTIGREVGNALGSSVGGRFGKKLGGNVGASLARGIFKTIFKF